MIEPYYSDDFVTIYNGDCVEILPTLSPCDVLLTDPPYGIGEAKGKNKSRSPDGTGRRRMPNGEKVIATSRDYGSSEWDNSTNENGVRLAREISREQIIFGGNYYDLPPSSCWLVWDKENGASDFADCELAWTNFEKAVRIFRHKWQGMWQKNMGNRKEVRIHPTQKPLDVMKWARTFADDSATTVLDPFCGSGTSLRAVLDHGKKAIGIDVSEKYCEATVERCKQRNLF